jgi:hypothetical protein
MIAILADADGSLRAWAPTVAELPTPGTNSIVRELEAWAAPPAPPYVWSRSAIDWVVPAVTPPSVLSRLQFRWRYTLAEQVAIKAAETDATDASVRATLAILRESLQEAAEISLTDPRTIAGVQYHASVGLITEARATEILTP